MGISDREYYRHETRGSAWFSGAAPACKAIILINVAVFVLDKFFPLLHFWLNADVSDITEKFQLWRLLTAAFVHSQAGVWHILFNMLWLWMIGREMESLYGTRDFTALYLSAAVFSTLCWTVVEASMGGLASSMVGASGAVMAVVVLYALYYPRREIVLFIFPIEMWLFLVIFLGFDLLQLTSASLGPSAYAAHLGGAAYGYLFKVGDLRLSRIELMFKRRPRLRVVSAEPREPAATRPSSGPTWSSSPAATTRPSATAVVPEEQFDQKLDEILVKIARDGRGALTEDENRILEEASRRARNRRSERI
jgi:membrane associated rhomboid family serine protease